MVEDCAESTADEEGDKRGGVFTSAAARRGAALRIIAVVCLVGGGAVVVQTVLPGVTDPDWIEHQLDGLGPVAPVAFVALQTGQVIFAPIPGQLLAGVGGYLFGAWLGAGYSMVGVVVGSTVVFLVSRRFGRSYAEQVIEQSALRRWDAFVDRGGVPALFVCFLLPTFPDDLLCFVAGLTDLRLRRFLVLVVVGRTPTFVAVAYAGTRLSDGVFGQFALVVTVLTLGSVAVYATRDRILARLDRI
jgi:Uncharacterized conserved protein